MTDGLPGWFSSDLRISTVVLDSSGRITYFGANAESLTGYRRNEVLGRDIQVLLNTPLASESRPQLAFTPSERAEMYQVRLANGKSRAVHVYRHPIPQPGGPPSTLLLAVDAVQANEAEAGLGLLNAFFQQSAFGFAILDTRLRYVALNEALARFNHRPLADHLGRHLRDVVNSADIDNYEALLRKVLRTGESLNGVKVAGHPTSAPGVEHVWSGSWYRLTEADGEPIGIAGVIMDITHQSEKVLDATRNRARLALLSKVGATQVTTLDLGEASQKLAEVLTSDYCDVATIDLVHDIVTGEEPPDNPTVDTLVSRAGASARVPSEETALLLGETRPRPASRNEPFARVLATNRPQLIVDPALADAVALASEPHRAEAAVNLRIASVLVVPLRARDSTLGVLACVRFEGREPFDNEDLLLASEIANRTALGIDNSRLYRDEKQTALTLQMSLLPRKLPELKEVELTYRYQANRATLRAGGDWFDVVELPGRRFAMVVGDVAGHGIDAAAAMGQYRTAVRTLASLGLEPAIVLTRLNELSFDFGEDITATCVYVVYDPTHEMCAIASAGHLPPILSLPDGIIEAHETSGGPLLGAMPHANYRASSLSVPAGSRLLLYSDGVVESPHTGIDDGIAALVKQMRQHRPAGELCDAIMDHTPSTRDDRTVLLAQFRGTTEQQ